MKIPQAAALVAFLLPTAGLCRPQVETPNPQPPKTQRPVSRSFSETIRKHLQRLGAGVDDSRSTPDMVVSTYPDPKGNKTTIVITNDRRKNLLGFYVYNFGNVAGTPNREEIFKYLLAANDAITIGSFFVDSEDDVGYKYLVSGPQTISQEAFGLVYLSMAAVAHERRPEIRKLLGADTDEKPTDMKKPAEDKPPQAARR
jgi:hypothetical protein